MCVCESAIEHSFRTYMVNGNGRPPFIITYCVQIDITARVLHTRSKTTMFYCLLNAAELFGRKRIYPPFIHQWSYRPVKLSVASVHVRRFDIFCVDTKEFPRSYTSIHIELFYFNRSSFIQFDIFILFARRVVVASYNRWSQRLFSSHSAFFIPE